MIMLAKIMIFPVQTQHYNPPFSIKRRIDTLSKENDTIKCYAPTAMVRRR